MVVVAVVNGIVLILLSARLLLMYSNATDFCTLILYHAVLLYLFIIFNKFLVEFLRFSLCKIMSPTISDSFTSSFPIWMPFTSLLVYIIALARTSNTMLNKSGNSGHPYHVSDLTEIPFSSSSLSMMLAMACYTWPLLF